VAKIGTAVVACQQDTTNTTLLSKDFSHPTGSPLTARHRRRLEQPDFYGTPLENTNTCRGTIVILPREAARYPNKLHLLCQNVGAGSVTVHQLEGQCRLSRFCLSLFALLVFQRLSYFCLPVLTAVKRLTLGCFFGSQVWVESRICLVVTAPTIDHWLGASCFVRTGRLGVSSDPGRIRFAQISPANAFLLTNAHSFAGLHTVVLSATSPGGV
jgi:hypothetical protein